MAFFKTQNYRKPRLCNLPGDTWLSTSEAVVGLLNFQQLVGPQGRQPWLFFLSWQNWKIKSDELWPLGKAPPSTHSYILPGSQLGTRMPEGGGRESSEEAAWGERRCRRLKSFPLPHPPRPCHMSLWASVSLVQDAQSQRSTSKEHLGTSVRQRRDTARTRWSREGVWLPCPSLPGTSCHRGPKIVRFQNFFFFFFSLFSRCLSSLNLSLWPQMNLPFSRACFLFWQSLIPGDMNRKASFPRCSCSDSH